MVLIAKRVLCNAVHNQRCFIKYLRFAPRSPKPPAADIKRSNTTTITPISAIAKVSSTKVTDFFIAGNKKTLLRRVPDACRNLTVFPSGDGRYSITVGVRPNTIRSSSRTTVSKGINGNRIRNLCNAARGKTISAYP